MELTKPPNMANMLSWPNFLDSGFLAFGAILHLDHLSRFHLFNLLSLHPSKFAHRSGRGKQLIDLFQAPVLKFWDEEICHDQHSDTDGSVDKADLTTKPSVLVVDEVGDGEGCNEGREHGDDTSEQICLFLNSRRSGFTDNNV